jgi:hypothetical protein
MSPLFLGLVLALLVVLGIVVLVVLNRFRASEKSLRLTVDPQPLVVRQYESGEIRVGLERRYWWGGRWYPAPATLLLRGQSSDTFSVDPARGGTSAEFPLLNFQVTGTKLGRGTFRLSVTLAGRNQACVGDLAVEVVPNPDNRGHIRHTPEALRASLRDR